MQAVFFQNRVYDKKQVLQEPASYRNLVRKYKVF